MNCAHWLNSTNDVEDKAAQTTCLVSTLLQGTDIDDLIFSIFLDLEKKIMHELYENQFYINLATISSQHYYYYKKKSSLQFL